MSLVRLLATGGTIASRRESGGHRATATGAEILATTTVPADCRVSITDAATVGSFAWQWPDLLALLRRIDDALKDGVDGVVVTHGTDTMEEVAFLTALAHDDPRPVVFTGAQRPLDHAAPDGPANLGDALLVASDPLARERGVLVSFDGRVHPARGTTKVDTLSTRGFTAPGRGPVLRLAGGRVQPLAPAARPSALPLDVTAEALPRVDVIPLYVGADDTLLRSALHAGSEGLVLAAFGAGNANPTLVGAIRDCGVPVLVCSRVPSGPVVPMYRGGGGMDLAEAGALFGEDLSPWQARMLLAVALAGAPHSPEELIRRWLAA
ncbi:L-asparaginase [Saccharopolyspora lacisalsi]|uniref:asparaginase n=1 Tax=Halosaccharopolyspora lacisalsi TaxID=1000566 RepID=A0A839DXS5_9PSEU|nr:asparaginase [Halosaccharopolyspora lacisalsi]MBA8825026.1 L-asparaginase [Halosaccharopolyspora lacisalsi]